MFSKLIFGYGKLIMRIYFAQIVIHIKIDFDFFIPSRVRIDHSAVRTCLFKFPAPENDLLQELHL